jgi:SAM-dependent methyltransferase
VHEDTARRLSFGERAELYDEVRLRYPDALFDAIAGYARVSAKTRVLEAGSGTGIATRPFAERGCTVVGLEVSDAMAAVARRNLAPFPLVEIHTSAFEDWQVEPGTFDLFTCAQAWHWLESATRCDRVADALRPGGAVALFGHGAVTNFAEGQAAYERYAPEWFVDPRPMETLEDHIDEFRRPLTESGRFRDIEVRHWHWWTRSYDADTYIRLISTYSDHATLPEPRRGQLYKALARAIEDAGGRIERPYRTVLGLARS